MCTAWRAFDNRHAGWRPATTRHTKDPVVDRREYDHAVAVPRTANNRVWCLGDRFSKSTRPVDLLQSSTGIEGDKAAVGRPERRRRRLADERVRQDPFDEGLHVSHPHASAAVAPAREEREMTPVRRDRRCPADNERRLRPDLKTNRLGSWR